MLSSGTIDGVLINQVQKIEKKRQKLFGNLYKERIR